MHQLEVKKFFHSKTQMTSVTTTLNFYWITPVHEWTCANLVDYYRKENIYELSKIFDSVKKNLTKVADVEFGFDVTRRMKAQELLNNWKVGLQLMLDFSS